MQTMRDEAATSRRWFSAIKGGFRSPRAILVLLSPALRAAFVYGWDGFYLRALALGVSPEKVQMF